MKIADGELRQLLLYDVKLPPLTVRELVADSKQTGNSLLRTTLRSGLVDEATLAKAQAKRIGVPFIDLDTTEILDETLHALPRQIAAKYQVICFDQTDSSIKLAMADPRDEKARKAIKDYSHKTVRRYQATSRGLTRAMRHYHKQAAPLHISTQDLMTTILEQAISKNLQDIHFEVHGQELLIKGRAGKRLQTISTLPASRLRALLSWCKLQIGSDVADTERPHHGRFTMQINGLSHDILVSTMPVVKGEKMVVRITAPAASIPDLKSLGYPTREITDLELLLKDGRGLVIIAGDIGSAAKVTLASLTKLATQQDHVAVTSIEQPLRYSVPEATQVEVTHALPYLDSVQAAIAQGPDILVVPQLGNSTTAEQLIDYSLSRHLVISGMYGQSLAAVLTQLQSYPITPALLAASLRLVVVQHQVDALCKRCRQEFTPTGPLKQALQDQFSFNENTRLYRQGRGCELCTKGHHGSVMVYEWLATTPKFQQLLATKADQQAIADYLEKHTTLTAQLRRLASKGIISIDEATRLAA